MYLHLGQEIVVNKNDIVGIYDMDTTTVSKHTREYLNLAEREKRVFYVSPYELPKSFVVVKDGTEERVYICPLSSQTLLKRSNIPIGELDKL
ncbi:MAG: extracellular matrix regulator RemB [Ruminococcus sp.]